MTQMVKNLPAMQETQVQSLSWEDLEKGMAREFQGQRSLGPTVHRVTKSQTRHTHALKFHKGGKIVR